MGGVWYWSRRQKIHHDIFPESGPQFDFNHPDVLAKAIPVENAANAIEKGFRALSLNANGDDDPLEQRVSGNLYRDILEVLQTHLPSLHQAFDEYVESVLATSVEKITCGPGCPSCCSHYVTSVEPFEILPIQERISTYDNFADLLFAFHERAALFASLHRETDGEEAEDRALHRYFLKARPCPLLTPEGVCGIRDIRPMSCRMYFSFSDPTNCKGKAILRPENRNFIVLLPDQAEIALARASRHLKEMGLGEHLADGLLRANELFGRFAQQEKGTSQREAPKEPKD